MEVAAEKPDTHGSLRLPGATMLSHRGHSACYLSWFFHAFSDTRKGVYLYFYKIVLTKRHKFAIMNNVNR